MLKINIDLKAILILGLAVALVLSFIFRPSVPIEEYEEEISVLQKQNEKLLISNDSIIKANIKLQKEIDVILYAIDSTKIVLRKTEDKLKELERKRNEVSNIVDNGDTLVIMNLEDAKVILNDLLEYEIADSLLTVYKEKDSLNTNTITLQKEVIFKLMEKSDNQQSQIDNFQQILDNKNSELGMKEDTIKQQKKELRKQKFLKFLGFGGSVILPIIAILILV